MVILNILGATRQLTTRHATTTSRRHAHLHEEEHDLAGQVAGDAVDVHLASVRLGAGKERDGKEGEGRDRKGGGGALRVLMQRTRRDAVIRFTSIRPSTWGNASQSGARGSHSTVRPPSPVHLTRCCALQPAVQGPTPPCHVGDGPEVQCMDQSLLAAAWLLRVHTRWLLVHTRTRTRTRTASPACDHVDELDVVYGPAVQRRP